MSPARRSLSVLAGFLALGVAPLRAADVEKVLPDDTQVVLTVNVRQILDSALVKKYVLPDFEDKLNTEVSKVVRLLGLNPVKEITAVTFAAPGGPDQDKWLGVISGSFDPARIQAAVDQFAKGRPEAVAVHQFAGARVYEDLSSKGTKTNWPRYFSLLDRNTVVLSPQKDYVAGAAARVAGKPAPGKLDAGLRSLIAKQDPKQSLWVAAVASKEMRQQLAKNGGARDFADRIQSISGGLTLTDDVRLNFRVQTNDANAARQLRQQLEAGKAVAVLAVSVNEELKDYAPGIIDVLNAFRFGQDQGTVSVELTIAGNLIEQNIKKSPKR